MNFLLLILLEFLYPKIFFYLLLAQMKLKRRHLVTFVCMTVAIFVIDVEDGSEILL